MNDNENKKSNEELADEALDQVAGGGMLDAFTPKCVCNSCGAMSKQSDIEAHNGNCPGCGVPMPV